MVYFGGVSISPWACWASPWRSIAGESSTIRWTFIWMNSSNESNCCRTRPVNDAFFVLFVTSMKILSYTNTYVLCSSFLCMNNLVSSTGIVQTLFNVLAEFYTMFNCMRLALNIIIHIEHFAKKCNIPFSVSVMFVWT